MKLLLIAALISSVAPLLAIATPTGTLKCQAMYRTFNADDQAEYHRAAMPMKNEAGPFFRYEANLNNRNFSVSEDILDDSYLGQITKAPSYTEGLVMRGRADKDGNFNVASVENRERVDVPADGDVPAKTKIVSDLYRITCQKISQN